MNKQELLNNLLLQGTLDNMPLPAMLQTISAKLGLEVYFCDPLGRVQIGAETDKFYQYLLNSFQGCEVSRLPGRLTRWVRENEIDHRRYYFRDITAQAGGSLLLVISYTEQELEFLEQAADLLVQAYRYYKKNDTQLCRFTDSFTDLLARELLLGKDENAELLIRQSGPVKLAMKPPYRILCCSAKNGFDSLYAASGNISKVIPSSFCILSDDKLFAFLYGAAAEFREQDYAQKNLVQFCKQYHLSCCISSRFTTLAHRQSYRAQAVTMLRVCTCLEPDCNLFFADDYYSEYIMMQAASLSDPGTLNLTAITYLEKTDRENGTVYLQTLECYLNHQRNAAAAARELFIDRTTLKYRLKKIDELIHVQLDEPRTALALKLAMLYRKLETRLNNSLVHTA